MKYTPPVYVRWLAIIIMALTGAGSGRALELGDALPPRQAVTEGRNVVLYAEYATGSIQWQVASKGSPAWTDVHDDGTYHGASTRTLEIDNVTGSLDGFNYRFIDTTAGVATTSNAAKLVVTPLLLPQPTGIMLDGMDGLLVSDASTHTIRRITNALMYAWGNDVTCWTYIQAGIPGVAGSDDGVVDMFYGASFNQPNGIVAATSGSAGMIAVADTANGMIRLINGLNVSTLAGSVSLRGNVDGAGLEGRGLVSFGAPVGIARDAEGSFYVADSSNHTIRKVTPNGLVSTFAGSPGNAGSADGLGAAARFNNPSGIAVDAATGTVYVADTNNNLIRKITPAGLVTTLAGTAGIAGSQDGTGSAALFNGPTGLAMGYDSYSLFVADTGNSTIRRIAGAEGVVTTYAGVPTVAGLREGQGYSYFDMLLDHPRALVYSPTGVLFIADTGNAAIRAISQYDGVTMTLPLSYAQAQVSSPLVPTSSPVTPVTPAPAPATPVATTTSPASTSGGGACSEWFLGALAGLGLLRSLVQIRRSAANT
jgi:sugar lactone lactonase YvrE